MTSHIPPERLSAGAAGELRPEEQERVADHLRSCPECAAQYEELRRAEQALTCLAEGEAAPELLHDLRRRLAAPRGRPRPWRWGVALAMAAGLTGGLLLWPHPPSPPPRPVTEASWRQPPAPLVEAPTEFPPGVLVKLPEPSPGSGRAATAVPQRGRYVLHREPKRPRPALSVPEVVLVRHGEEGEAGRLGATSAREHPVAVEEAAETEGGGVVLLLGEPLPALPSSQCYLEVTLPEGHTSIFERAEERDRTGQLQTARISCQNSIPVQFKPNGGG